MVKTFIRESLDFLLHAKYCPYWMPWFYADEDMKKLHLLSLQRARKFKIENGKRWSMLIQTPLWPLLTLVQASRNMFREEARYVAKQDHCPGIIRQFIQQLVLANRFNIRPDVYFDYYFWKKNNYNRAARYIFSPQFAGLLEILRHDADAGSLKDKSKFFLKCQEHGLPVAPIIAVAHKGKLFWFDEVQKIPSVDIFIKPRDGLQGAGAESWAYNGKNWERKESQYTEVELLQHIKNLSMNQEYIFMPRLLNHPEMMPFTSGALATLRIITCYTPPGPPVLIFLVLRMPTGSMEVDNFHAGGIAALVSSDGTLGPAAAMKITFGQVTHHPDTGMQIKGTKLPLFTYACSLCERAHAIFPEIAIIGWDIAITSDGPILLEGNDTPGIDSPQGPFHIPIGETEFVQWAHKQIDWLARSYTPANATEYRNNGREHST